MNKIKLISLLVISLVLPGFAIAEPTSSPVKITSLRTYIGNGVIYVSVDSSSFCASTFTIDTKVPGGKEAYATALAAFIAGKSVAIEISTASGCAGWGTPVQSIYIQN